MADINEMTALANSAFLHGNVTARGKLTRLLTNDEADKIAQAYGLQSIDDYKTKNKNKPAELVALLTDSINQARVVEAEKQAGLAAPSLRIWNSRS
jgi:hypothetical protein